MNKNTKKANKTQTGAKKPTKSTKKPASKIILTGTVNSSTLNNFTKSNGKKASVFLVLNAQGKKKITTAKKPPKLKRQSTVKKRLKAK